MKKKSRTSISFTLGDLFPKEPGIFPEDIEKKYDEFVQRRTQDLKRSFSSWKHRKTMNKNIRRDYE